MFISSSNQAMYRWHQPPMFLLSRYGFVELGSLVNSKPWTSSLRIKGFSLLRTSFFLGNFSCCKTLLQIEYIRYPLNPTTNQPVFAYIYIVPALPKQLYMCSPLKLGPFTHTHTPTNYRNFASQPWEVAPRSSFFWELLSNYQPQEPKTGCGIQFLTNFLKKLTISRKSWFLPEVWENLHNSVHHHEKAFAYFKGIPVVYYGIPSLFHEFHPGRVNLIRHHPPRRKKLPQIIDSELRQDATGSCSKPVDTRFTRFSRRRRAAKPALESLVKVTTSPLSRVASESVQFTSVYQGGFRQARICIWVYNTIICIYIIYSISNNKYIYI